MRMPIRDGRHQQNAMFATRSAHYRAAATPGVKRTLIPIILFTRPHPDLDKHYRMGAAKFSILLLFKLWRATIANPRVPSDAVGAFATDFQTARSLRKLCEGTSK